MIRYAIINTTTKKIENVVEYASTPSSPPPGFSADYIAVANAGVGPEWTWNGAALAPPVIVPPPAPPQTVLSQDLMAQFTVADFTAIKTAVANSDNFGLLWASLQAQKDPMIITKPRFKAGWSALITVLGATRMAAIATALGVTIV